MNICNSYDNGKLKLLFRGELDHHCALSSMKTIDELVDEYLPRECIIDLAQLKFMDSSGIGVILRVYKKMNGMSGKIKVENCKGQPARVLDASGIGRLITIS